MINSGSYTTFSSGQLTIFVSLSEVRRWRRFKGSVIIIP